MPTTKRRKPKRLKRVLRGDIRVEGDARYGCALCRYVNEFVEEGYITVPAVFHGGDKVRVTVELVSRREKRA